MQNSAFSGGAKLAVNKTVFLASSVITVALILFTILFPAVSETVLGGALKWVSDHFGWYYMLVVAAYGVFSLFVGVSRYGDIKLGQDQDKPAFPFLAWAAMLFSAGIGIDLLFFGVSEPLTHYLAPNIGEGSTPEAARAALAQTFLHWGLHGWGIYALIGMALAYFAYRKNMPLALRSALLPIFGQKRVNGWLGNTVDIFGVVCTLLGIATSLGIGVLQANAGLNHVFGIDTSKTVQTAIILGVVAAAALSAMSGVDKGVRRLSEINMLGATGLLIALLVMGPTVFLFNGLVDNIGSYFQTIMDKTFRVYAYEGESGAEWKSAWTIFFWAWWVAWAPFVGLFIARISRGRTLREFVFGVMFIPLGFIFAWFSIFGNSAIDLVNSGQAADLAKTAVENPAMGMFLLFEHYPLAGLWSTMGVIIGLIFFVTSADSGALVLANLSSRDLASTADAPVWLRLFWAAGTGLVTLGLLFAGGFASLQSVSVVAGLPFSLILVLYMISMWISLRQEGMKRKAGQVDRALVLDNGLNWRNRLSRLTNFPDLQTAKHFMTHTLEQAMAEVAIELEKKRLEVELTTENGGLVHQIAVRYPEQSDFIYRVELIEAEKPIFALGQAGNLASSQEHEKYYRAEVFLIEGSQDYDILGYTKEQAIIDILNQYERHIQFLYMDR
ncbi:high-affinity choline transporter BetT [Neisseria sp. N95_16]|uniref:BCCT family transporter n=1 Tax=Neisseria brasiliensis TaxID=2666100 RepID=A0A5Q3S0I9_9NEIS|nr:MULTISPECIES: choline BCCT transporter BetT [Neisseria]MRN38466.1 BCCT family transporter [Neisseria brasiliensis]PJO08625.1 high-affinity choline transporter BetT [Neisseria sp. N95_16]PJO77359.1 high-affinity choline transporter BetT [Neisseria sp. N177_16]QGL25455.1 BCCT family transporter [Neisseria brasiliensis]